MVIRGRTRGNGSQLANYLLAKGENQHVQILDVDGREQANNNSLRNALLSMSLTAELTRSDKGLYHAQINPAYGEDKAMTIEDWQKAADILGKELGFDEQRRVIVLHTKKDRTHAHVVWERYDHQKGKMISDSFSRLAQDRARKDMEKAFEHARTPERNRSRPEMKKALSDLWRRFQAGRDFIAAAKQAGYTIAAGLQRRPFMVVDDTGRSFDLVRQIEGSRTKDVRERLKGESLPKEKDAIAFIRQRQKLQEVQQREAAQAEPANDNSKKESMAASFAENRGKITTPEEKKQDEKNKAVAGLFQASNHEMTKPKQETCGQDRTALIRAFAENREDKLTPKQEKERRRQEFIRQFKPINRDRDLER